jgi:hypothetical protein
MEKKNKGLTIMLVFGSYGGFYINFKDCIRICFGWVAFTVYYFDMENILEKTFLTHKE